MEISQCCEAIFFFQPVLLFLLRKNFGDTFHFADTISKNTKYGPKINIFNPGTSDDGQFALKSIYLELIVSFLSCCHLYFEFQPVNLRIKREQELENGTIN